jgi:hypothetical protein
MISYRIKLWSDIENCVELLRSSIHYKIRYIINRDIKNVVENSGLLDAKLTLHHSWRDRII